MVFSWPSKAKLLDYGYDRESAMWSRDALEQVLAGSFARARPAACISSRTASARSLTMEALRQIYARLGLQAIERTGAVVFAAPDIDMDVFSSSVERVGALAAQHHRHHRDQRPRARGIGLDRGRITRVGAAEAAALTKFGVRVIDASQEGWGIVNHDLFLSNAQIRQVIKTAIDGRLSDGT